MQMSFVDRKMGKSVTQKPMWHFPSSSPNEEDVKGIIANNSAAYQVNVRSISEKLKCLKPLQEDMLKLGSVKAVLRALKDSKCISTLTEDLQPAVQNQVHSSPVSVANKSFIEKQAPHDTIKDTGFRSVASCPKNKSSKHFGSTSCDYITSFNVPAEKVISVSMVFATLVHNFKKLVECVRRKHMVIVKPRKLTKSNICTLFFSILAFIFYFQLHTPTGFSRFWLKWENVELCSVKCTIETPNLVMELLRPPVSCTMCRNVQSVDRVRAISPLEFENLYAYSGRPVIVTDAMANWTARGAFSFKFLKDIYDAESLSLQHFGQDCHFFPYATEFLSLAEVFNMTKERSERPWYIGWSNCDAKTGHILRLHYQRPYFLPDTAESTHANWIFIGTTGFGAPMHIDHVLNPSWQGQITGRKRWHFQPPPECHYECHSFHVDVHPGEISLFLTQTNGITKPKSWLERIVSQSDLSTIERRKHVNLTNDQNHQWITSKS